MLLDEDVERRSIMNMRDLVPRDRGDRERSLAPSSARSDPFLTLHREMNRLFDDVFRGFDMPTTFAGPTPAGGAARWPSLEVEETEGEYRVTAELPGLSQEDVEVLFDDGVLTMRGERRVENEDRARAFSERYYGRFERRLALDRNVEPDKISAIFENGLLTVTVPKSEPEKNRATRIPISGRDQTAH
jgi:HSP20 family protein